MHACTFQCFDSNNLSFSTPMPLKVSLKHQTKLSWMHQSQYHNTHWHCSGTLISYWPCPMLPKSWSRPFGMIILFGSISTNLTDFESSVRVVYMQRNVTFNNAQLHALYSKGHSSLYTGGNKPVQITINVSLWSNRYCRSIPMSWSN